MVKGLIVFFVLATSAILTALARRRAAAEEARGGCVACGATGLVIDGASARCTACGYVGAADRGGALTEADFHALKNEEVPWDRE
ncbi:MAG: hypothetical protein R3B09_19850 [Nannocystaceae bacterium]